MVSIIFESENSRNNNKTINLPTKPYFHLPNVKVYRRRVGKRTIGNEREGRRTIRDERKRRRTIRNERKRRRTIKDEKEGREEQKKPPPMEKND